MSTRTAPEDQKQRTFKSASSEVVKRALPRRRLKRGALTNGNAARRAGRRVAPQAATTDQERGASESEIGPSDSANSHSDGQRAAEDTSEEQSEKAQPSGG